MKKNQTILAIETSCDETAAAVLSVDITQKFPKIKTLSSIIKSQIKLHAKMGGVVPDIAARAHLKYIRPVVTKALKDSKVRITDLDYIAVTQGPGLIPSLLVGVEFAKMLSLATGTPLLPINHMAGHLYSPFTEIRHPQNLFPMVSLIVSGGHTMIVVMKDSKNYTVVGHTVDDAAGEAFDKVAKLLGLPYPGGPIVSRLATKIKKTSFEFPRPMVHSKDYNFSFSGLKTAVLYHVQDLKLKIEDSRTKSEICKAFEDAVVDILAIKTLRAVKEYKAKSVSVTGGVSANTALQKRFQKDCKENNLKLFFPKKGLSTDNAEMIGIAAAFALANKVKIQPTKKVIANPNLAL